MREYELMYIVHPDLDDNAVKEIIGRIAGWIGDSGGQVVTTDLWGKRDLAYPIRKQRQGNYVLVNMKIDPKECAKLERNLRFLEPVMRFQIIAK